MRTERAIWRFIGAALVAAGAHSSAMAGTTLSSSYVSADGRELGLVYSTPLHGLKGQAVFRLLQTNRTIEILLTNTSDGVPTTPNFSNPSDQILTSLYFDLGAPGLNANDPQVTGGAAYVGDDSELVGPANKIAAQGTNLSNRWGYGNFQYTEAGMDFLPPNFVSALTAHTTSFTGSGLAGPDWGVISGANLLGGHDAGLPAVSDTVRFLVNVDREITDLRDIIAPGNYVSYIEFGSDYEFRVGDEPPPEVPTGAVPELATLIGVLMAAVAAGWAVRGRLPLEAHPLA